mgnify:CR=1 FL=1
MTFGDHLRSQENIVFVAAEGFDDAVTAVLAARRVLVEADDAAAGRSSWSWASTFSVPLPKNLIYCCRRKDRR